MQDAAPSPDCFCAVEPDRERVTVRVGGELDLSAASHVEGLVDELLDVGFRRIVVDLRELTFLDSAGVHMLVAAQRSAERREGALSLIGGPPHVQRVLELTATASLFAIDAAVGRG
jgi:anti-sigma B factor antagonist